MRIRKLTAALLLGGLFGACNTPSIPLPPPDLMSLTIESKTPGHVDLVGTPSSRHANVLFSFVDEPAADMGLSSGVIFQTNADGSFVSPEISAKVGDGVELYYDMGSQRSQSWFCTLQLGQLNNTICH
jgi:hypothetical protein